MNIRLGLIAPFPPPYAGMTVLANTLKLSLEQNGVIVNTINTSVATPRIVKKIYFGVIYQYLNFYFECFKILKSNIVIIISSSGGSFYFKVLPSLFLCRILNKEVILDFVGGGILNKLNPKNIFLLRLFKNILVPTSVFEQAFSKKGIKCTVFPHIVNIERFTCEKSQNGKIVLLAAKALVKYSGIDHLIKVFSIVKKEYANAELIIAGDGQERKFLENLVFELNLIGVKFIGNVKYEDMPSFYQNATVFIHGTQIESFGIALVEAMASGTPIVSTNVGGIPDVIDENITGFLVNYGDYTTMAERVKRLLNDKVLYDRFSKNGILKAENFGPSELSMRLIEIINLVLDKTKK